MKQEKTIIFLVFVLIVLLGVGIFCFAYRPVFSGPISTKHADWEAFGDFFWGLGTMLFTGLSVWVLFSVNRSLNEFNENLQTKQQEFEQRLEKDRQRFEIELEEKRIKAQKDILNQKRIDYWQEEYHQIILQLIPGGVKTDAEWLNVLRKVTVLYKSMQAEQLLGVGNDAENISSRMDDINKFIIIVLNETYNAKGLKTKNDYMLKYIALNMLILQLYFDIFQFKEGDVAIEMKDIFPEQKEQNS